MGRVCVCGGGRGGVATQCRTHTKGRGVQLQSTSKHGHKIKSSIQSWLLQVQLERESDRNQRLPLVVTGAATTPPAILRAWSAGVGAFAKRAGTPAHRIVERQFAGFCCPMPCCAVLCHVPCCAVLFQAALDAESRHQLESAVSRAAAAAATLKEAKVRQRHGAVAVVVGFARGAAGQFAGHEGAVGCTIGVAEHLKKQALRAWQAEAAAAAESHCMDVSSHGHPQHIKINASRVYVCLCMYGLVLSPICWGMKLPSTERGGW